MWTEEVNTHVKVKTVFPKQAHNGARADNCVDRSQFQVLVGWRRYAAALALLGVAAFLQWAAQPVFRDLVPFMFFFPALLLTAVYLGPGPAIAVLSGSLLAAALIETTFGTLPTVPTAHLYASLGFLLVGSMIAVLGTNLRQARRDISDSDAKLRRVKEYAEVGVWDADLSAQVVVASPMTWKLVGAEPSADRVPWATFADRLYPGDASPNLARIIESGSSTSNVLEIERRAGASRSRSPQG